MTCPPTCSRTALSAASSVNFVVVTAVGEAHKNHKGVCPQESVYYENKCGVRMVRRLLVQHATSECPKRSQPCAYFTKKFVYGDTIQSHQYKCPGLPVFCPNQCGMVTVAREDLPTTHLKDRCSTAFMLCPFKESGCKHRCRNLAGGHHVEESTGAVERAGRAVHGQ